MLSRPDTQQELRERIRREVAATTARMNASHDGMIEQIVGTHRMINECRKLMARVDLILARD
jgi:hypothetical protein